MADVVEVNDLEQLESYRLAWNALLPQTARASFFHSFDWFQTYWKHFGHDQQMRVLVVRAAGMPIGIVPLCVRKEKFQVGRLRVLTYPLSDWGMWYGPIGGDPSATLFMALRHLRDTRRDWDMVDLRWSAANPSDQGTTGRALRAVGWRSTRSIYQTSSIIRLAAHDWESYSSSISKKWRHEINRQRRALHRKSRVTIDRYRPAGAAHGEDDPRWDVFGRCLEISRRSWQAQSTNGNTLCHSHVADFLHDCHAAAARLGMLDVAVMCVDDVPAAFQYNYHFDGNVYGLRMGYDPQFSRQGVGKVLMADTIRDSFARGDQTIDMGIGDFAFKRHFRTDIETSYRYACYPWQAWKSQGVRLTRWLKRHWGVESSEVDGKVKSGSAEFPRAKTPETHHASRRD